MSIRHYKRARKVPEHVASLMFDTYDECHWFTLAPGTKNSFTYNEGLDVTMTINYDYTDNLTVTVENSPMEIPLCETLKLYIQEEYTNLRTQVYEYNFNDFSTDKNEHTVQLNGNNKNLYLGVYIGENDSVKRKLTKFK